MSTQEPPIEPPQDPEVGERQALQERLGVPANSKILAMPKRSSDPASPDQALKRTPGRKPKINAKDDDSVVAKTLRQFEDEIGGREKVVDVLVHASGLTDSEEYLLNIVADPAYRTMTLHHVCRTAGMHVGDFLRLFGKARGAKAYLAAMEKVHSKIPAVAEAVMERALPTTVTCGLCGGEGFRTIYQVREDREDCEIGDPPRKVSKIPVKVTCTQCSGEKVVIVQPDHEVQKTALTLGGILKSKEGTTVNTAIQANFNVPRSSPNFRSATDRLLYPGAAEPTVTAEISETPES